MVGTLQPMGYAGQPSILVHGMRSDEWATNGKDHIGDWYLHPPNLER